VRRLDRTECQPDLFEVTVVFQFTEDFEIKVGPDIKPFHTPIVELQVKGEIIVSCYCNNFIHLCYFTLAVNLENCLTIYGQPPMELPTHLGEFNPSLHQLELGKF